MTLTREEKEDHVVFAVSFLIHVVAILCLASYFVTDDTKEAAVVILSATVEEPALEQQASIQDISTFSETETRLVLNERSQPDPVVVDNDTPQQKVTLDDLTFSSTQVDFLSESDSLARDHSEVASNAQGEGAANEGVASVAGAVDRLTAEIVGSAAQKETLVVWLFDASLSLNAQRQRIAGRLEKILAELKHEEDIYPVRHVVCGFGEKLDILIKEPTDDTDKIVTQIRDIRLDESGVENIFTCITRLASDYASTKIKRTMIIAFTDEVGDDQAQADHTAVVAGQNAVAVYVVGTPAPFGIARTQLKFVDPDEQFDQSERWVEIEQGPESLFKMTLNILSVPIDSEPMDSGYGPYALSRLCALTGGIYFALHPNRNAGEPIQRSQIQPMSSNIQHFFDSRVMKAYTPDYRSASAQKKEAENHQAKRALVAACSSPPIDFQRDFKTVFDAPNQGQFVAELSEAQMAAVTMLTKADLLCEMLKRGEKDCQSLKERRWRASYFLAMGRILAIKTRLDAYNAILGDAKNGLKAKEKNTNRWILEPSDDFKLLNTTIKKQSESAKKYLKTVVEECPGTPWALVASTELDLPFAYKWVESHFDPVAIKTGGNPNPPATPRDDERKVLPQPKPQRKFDKI